MTTDDQYTGGTLNEISRKLAEEQKESAEIPRMLERAINEIKHLRGRNELMQARLTMFDNVMQLLNANPHANGYTDKMDLAFEIQELVDRLRKKKPPTETK